VLAQKAKVQLVGDKALMDPAAPRSGRVEVTLADGRTVSHFTRHAPGTPENPMDTAAVNAKAQSLMTRILGSEKTQSLVKSINALEDVKDVRELQALLSSADH
jgi:2-methylcitrate dehydratase PrpD